MTTRWTPNLQNLAQICHGITTPDLPVPHIQFNMYLFSNNVCWPSTILNAVNRKVTKENKDPVFIRANIPMGGKDDKLFNGP